MIVVLATLKTVLYLPLTLRAQQGSTMTRQYYLIAFIKRYIKYNTNRITDSYSQTLNKPRVLTTLYLSFNNLNLIAPRG